MSDLSFIWPLSGGVLIGLSAGLYLLLIGWIAGISGLTASAFGWTDAGSSPLGIGLLAGIIAGAVLFGLAWGLVGLCPGPAIASLVTGRWEAVLFAMAMVAGMFAYKNSNRARTFGGKEPEACPISSMLCIRQDDDVDRGQ